MPTPSEISYALSLIDAYIDQIEDWEATGKYDRHFKEFIDFLKEYGANVGEVMKIIKNATGKAPAEIRSKGEAQEVRELLRRTMTSEYLGRRIPPDKLSDSDQWVRKNVSFSFEQESSDPYEDEK